MHFAVSGSNFSIVCGAAVLGVRLLGASTRLTVLLGLVVMAGFVVLVRPTDSVLRAAIMGGVGLAGALASRRAQALPALGAAVVVIMLVWPQMAVAPGFWLSVLATLGLVLWAAPIRVWLARRRVPDALAVLLAMSLAAQILTLPVVVAISGRLSLVTVLANVAVAPVVGVIALCGTSAALLAGLGPPGGVLDVPAELLIRATGPEMWWLVGCADTLGGRAWAAPHVPGPVTAAVLVVVGVTVWVMAGPRRAAIVTGVRTPRRRGRVARWFRE
ncbi:MAG: ComEC/Rec2 family competence protein [Gordonia sp. (in: high G+C Gram-positive bacteria)]|uniref:ComEC/Rec2 family competence protein n=1 Tax=Gordonia sp. (in: high G+C Gram-positive bacteria) TaxID=84139 RepID=UPI0039E3B596